jgi:hypothetical protein
MPSQSAHPDMTLVIRNVRRLAHHQNQQQLRPPRNSQLPPSKRRVSVLVGERDTSPGGSFVPSTIQDLKSMPSSSLNYSRVADITQRMSPTPSTTLQQSTNTSTATRSHSTPAPRGTLQTHSTHLVVSSPAFSFSCTPTPLSRLEILPTPISNQAAHVIITNPM